jgi:hypothetical protein
MPEATEAQNIVEMDQNAVEKYYPDPSPHVRAAPLQDLYQQILQVDEDMENPANAAYNPGGLRQKDFRWKHVILTGAGGAAEYTPDVQLMAESVRTGRVMSSDLDLVLKNNSQTYIFELNKLSGTA